jgi:hypothetical protein
VDSTVAEKLHVIIVISVSMGVISAPVILSAPPLCNACCLQFRIALVFCVVDQAFSTESGTWRA